MADDNEEKKRKAASDLLSAGLVKAKEEGKSVFLAFGSPSCGWCAKLEKYHRDPEVAQVLGKHLVHVKVDTVKNPGGKELYKKYDKIVEHLLSPFSMLMPSAGRFWQRHS